MTLEDWRGWPVLSPDARSLVVPVSQEGRGLLALRRIDDAGVVALAGTDGAWGPFFSPSGRLIAFMSNGKLRRLEIAGGLAVPLADLGRGQPIPGGSWNAKGILLFAASFDTALFKVSEAGGAAQAASTLDAARGDAGHRFPQFLPDGKSFLFNVRGREPGLMRASARFSRHQDAAAGCRAGFLHGSGIPHLPARSRRALGTLRRRASGNVGSAHSFRGSGVPDSILWNGDGRLCLSLRRSHLCPAGLVCAQRFAPRAGRQAGTYRQVALSPSGRRAALQHGDAVSRGTEADIWNMDLATGVVSKVTTDAALETDPAWSPDERRIAFISSCTGRNSVFVKDLATGRETQLFEYPTGVVLDSWSPDGRFIIFRSLGRLILAVPAAGEARPRLIVENQAPVNEQSHVSPDGRWIAYSSDESGTWQVYAVGSRSFPASARSSQGGIQPMWRRDGRELDHLSTQRQLMVVDIRNDGAGGLDIDAPRELFRLSWNPSAELGEERAGRRRSAVPRSNQPVNGTSPLPSC